MVKGKVIHRFQDKNTKRIYGVGDEFKTSSSKRFNELVDLEFVKSIEEKEQAETVSTPQQG